ncbi:MAG: AEC family transporter [Aquificae bacterium]|nr:AEC family transporter [Aquificota bacterium]
MIENLFSVVLFFSLGYLARKKGIFDKEGADTLIRFIIYFAFPSLVVYNVYHLQIKPSFFFVILAGWLVVIFSILISFLAGKVLGLDRKSLASFVMMSSFGNTSFLGFPFQMALLGEEGLRYAVVFDQLASFLPVSLLSPFILAYGRGEGGFSIDLKKVITFPPFVAVVFAFVVKQFYVPDFVLEGLKTLGMTVIPLALFSVGINLQFSRVRERLRDISAVIFIKMIFVPLVFLGVLAVLGVEMDTAWRSALIEVAMPPMVLASIFVIGAGLDRELAVSSVGVGILVSFITVPFIFYLSGLV